MPEEAPPSWGTKIKSALVFLGVAFFLSLLLIFGLSLLADQVRSALGVDTNPEYHEYLSIRDYSNCTLGNDSICLHAGCVHAYRQCQIEHCGSTGIGW